MPAGPSSLGRALDQLSEGDESALEEVFQLAYDELRAVARARLRALRPGETLETSALVHEVYLRVREGNGAPCWESSAHFFAFASKAMRHLLVDRARRKHSLRRGGDRNLVTLHSQIGIPTGPGPVDLLELDAALRQLGRRSSRMERLVECRFFGGMSEEETAEVLGVSTRTVAREWTRARAYLHALMWPGMAQSAHHVTR
ncbi:ECF-type sigma factor [soil metagenome]